MAQGLDGPALMAHGLADAGLGGQGRQPAGDQHPQRTIRDRRGRAARGDVAAGGGGEAVEESIA